MSLFDGIRKKYEERKGKQVLTSAFKMMSSYNPIYTSYDGGLYEMALTRSCIDKIATQCSKLHPVINANKNYKKYNTI